MFDREHGKRPQLAPQPTYQNPTTSSGHKGKGWRKGGFRTRTAYAATEDDEDEEQDEEAAYEAWDNEKGRRKMRRTRSRLRFQRSSNKRS